VLDEACAHAQATARVSPELDRLIRERRKVDALIRRGHGAERTAAEPMADLATVFERIGREIEDLLGGEPREAAQGKGEKTADASPAAAPPRSTPTLADRRAELDRLLRAELESQGVTVTGNDIARVVSAAVGKGIEWAG